MPVDEKEFFREITLRICGNLEIEEGLRSCLEYLAKFMPADSLYLEKNEHELGAMRFVARARLGKGEKMNALVPYTEAARQEMAKMALDWSEGSIPPVYVFNRPLESPITRCLEEALGDPYSSVMSVPLIIGDQIAGALVLLAEGDYRYTEEHARLYATLKETFFVAMSNILKHKEIVRLKDLLADDNRYLHRELKRLTGERIVGEDFGLKHVMEMVRQVAALDSPVLLLGETGVGKDVIANAIHDFSLRRKGPFIRTSSPWLTNTLEK